MQNLVLNESVSSQNLDDYMMLKKFEIMIEMNNNKLNSELNGIKNELTRLSREITDIKINYGIIKEERQNNEPLVAMEKKDANHDLDTLKRGTSNASLKNATVSGQQGTSMPRYGHYQPGDVEIGKFFYCGSKK
ncbi:MAG: hypothetical protein ABII01_05440 [Candidatus Woesearchaeota archaeon]